MVMSILLLTNINRNIFKPRTLMWPGGQILTVRLLKNTFLRHVKQVTTDRKLMEWCDILTAYINEGMYARLPRELKAISREYKGDRTKMKSDEYKIQDRISKLIEEYQINTSEEKSVKELSDPRIIISETFI